MESPLAPTPLPLLGPSLADYVYIHDALNIGSALMWFFGYCAVMLKLQTERSALGLSLQTFFALVFTETNNVILQLILRFKYNVQLGSLFYFCDCATTALSTFCFWYILRFYSNTYERDRDTFGAKFLGKKLYMLCLYLIAFAFGGVLFLLRRSIINVPLWLSLYECVDDAILAIALVPQLYMFYNKRPRKVSALLGHFVIFMFLARFIALLFWITYPYFKAGPVWGRGVRIVTECLNVLILLDFLYYYVKARLKGQKEISLPI